MTDWHAVAQARGSSADQKVTDALAALETKFRPLEKLIAHETEPAIFYVLLPELGE